VPVWNFVRRGVYHDSVTLMRLSRDLEALPGVSRAAAMMGTPPNRELLAGAGLLGPEGEAAGPADLVVAVVADAADAAAAARAAAETALAVRRGAPGAPAAHRPRTLAAACRALDGASLALVSVPGLYAGAEARRALRLGLHVMLFSDNVPVETEVALKREALERGLLLMGPDCGTAIVAGLPLGFANVVPRGRIGLAAASGTGLQEVACLVAAAGEGVSHALGVGGRDLSDAVGGLMTDRALALLAADPGTAVVCVVGKPPGRAVLTGLTEAAARLGKPCVLGLVGAPGPPAATVPGGPTTARTLEDAARAAVALARGEAPRPVEFTLAPDAVERLTADAAAGLGPGQRFVRGVYAGGTLAWEAVALLGESLADVAPGVSGGGDGHRVVDLGEDVFTVGRPHPMIDGAVRREWIEREGRDPATAVLLLDLVLGWGAHPDPAGEILPAIARAQDAARAAGRRLAVVASVIGTDADPQGRTAQAAALAGRGVVVMPSNAQAARLAARIARRREAS
jgi:succinyl-CoA synthetase alpha subunit